MSKFATYWLVNGDKITSEAEMRRRVLSGENAIEVSADMQQRAVERREALREAHEILRAARSAAGHDASAVGQQEAALRHAERNPGGVISTGESTQLDLFLPDKTNELR